MVMRRLTRLLLLSAACAALTVPALAEQPSPDADAPEAVAEMEFDLPDMIVIEEEEVPLAAMPMVTAAANLGPSAQALTTAGVLMMGVSAFGIIWKRVSHAREDS